MEFRAGLPFSFCVAYHLCFRFSLFPLPLSPCLLDGVICHERSDSELRFVKWSYYYQHCVQQQKERLLLTALDQKVCLLSQPILLQFFFPLGDLVTLPYCEIVQLPPAVTQLPTFPKTQTKNTKTKLSRKQVKCNAYTTLKKSVNLSNHSHCSNPKKN